MNNVPTRTVTIPSCENHGGYKRCIVTLDWICPACGGPRGDVRPAISWDGSRRLHCDGWINACGHIDHYTNVRREARNREQAILARKEYQDAYRIERLKKGLDESEFSAATLVIKHDLDRDTQQIRVDVYAAARQSIQLSNQPDPLVIRNQMFKEFFK